MTLEFNRANLSDTPISVVINEPIECDEPPEENVRHYLGASAIGSECQRQIQFDWMADSVHASQTRDIFRRGHPLETLTREHPIRAGFKCAPDDRLGFRAAGSLSRGHATGSSQQDRRCRIGYPCIWEHKALGDKGWKALERDGLEKVYPQYAAQTWLYQAYLDVTEHPAIFTAANVNTMARSHVLQEFNAQRAQAWSDRAIAVIEAICAGELLPRLSEDPNDWRRRICGHRERCGALHHAHLAVRKSSTFMRSPTLSALGGNLPGNTRPKSTFAASKEADARPSTTADSAARRADVARHRVRVRGGEQATERVRTEIRRRPGAPDGARRHADREASQLAARDLCEGKATMNKPQTHNGDLETRAAAADLIVSFARVLPRRRRSLERPSDFGSVVCSMPLGFLFGLRFGRPGPPLSRAISSRSAATVRCKSATSSNSFKNQQLQLGRRKSVNVLGQRHAPKQSDSCRLGNLIILPPPQILPLLPR